MGSLGVLTQGLCPPRPGTSCELKTWPDGWVSNPLSPPPATPQDTINSPTDIQLCSETLGVRVEDGRSRAWGMTDPSCRNAAQVWGDLGRLSRDCSPRPHVRPQTKDPLTCGAALTPVSRLYPKSLFF